MYKQKSSDKNWSNYYWNRGIRIVKKKKKGWALAKDKLYLHSNFAWDRTIYKNSFMCTSLMSKNTY